MFRKVKFSIRLKVALTILVLLSSAVSLYFLFAANLFKQDKEAYIYEQGLNHGKTLAKQVTSFFSKSSEDMALISTLRYDEKQTELLNQIFENNKSLISFFVFNDSGDIQFSKIDNEQLNKFNLNKNVFISEISKDSGLTSKIIDQGKLLLFKKNLGELETDLFFLYVYDVANETFLLGAIDSSTLMAEFKDSKIYESLLLDGTGTPLINPLNRKIDRKNQDFNSIVKSKAQNGTQKIEFTGQGTFLTTFSSISDLGLKIIAQVELKEAFRALNFLLQMSGLFALLIISIGVVSAIFGAKQLTRPVQALMEGTVAVGKGDFTTKVKVKSQDELGVLSDSFNFMSGEIIKYMDEVKEKTRMEGELAVAQLVQDSFFSKQTMNNDYIDIAGSYASASECGGDWWGFSELGDKTVLYIGDATGHGVPAALVTATTFCCVNIFENMGEKNPEVLESPKDILELMNHAVHKMGGQILMTFFVAVIDHKNNKITYANASHNPPYLLKVNPDSEEAPTKADIVPLMENPGFRLGHEAGSTYENHEIEVSNGDIITFFTDGIIEGQNPKGKEYGDRRFIKSILKHHELPAADMLDQMHVDAESFFEGVEVDDDVTLAIVKVKS